MPGYGPRGSAYQGLNVRPDVPKGAEPWIACPRCLAVAPAIGSRGDPERAVYQCEECGLMAYDPAGYREPAPTRASLLDDALADSRKGWDAIGAEREDG